MEKIKLATVVSNLVHHPSSAMPSNKICMSLVGSALVLATSSLGLIDAQIRSCPTCIEVHEMDGKRHEPSYHHFTIP